MRHYTTGHLEDRDYVIAAPAAAAAASSSSGAGAGASEAAAAAAEGLSLVIVRECFSEADVAARGAHCVADMVELAVSRRNARLEELEREQGLLARVELEGG